MKCTNIQEDVLLSTSLVLFIFVTHCLNSLMHTHYTMGATTQVVAINYCAFILFYTQKMFYSKQHCKNKYVMITDDYKKVSTYVICAHKMFSGNPKILQKIWTYKLNAYVK